jgi:hypothetical protein
MAAILRNPHMNEIRFGLKFYLIGPPDSDDAGQFLWNFSDMHFVSVLDQFYALTPMRLIGG